MSERVHVHCRIKPLLSSAPEGETGSSSTFVTHEQEHKPKENGIAIEVDDEAPNTQVLYHKGPTETLTYTYDSIVSPEASQEQVYQQTAFPIIQDVMEGYNGTILAYGQTNSGKTHTMLGPENQQWTSNERGIIPRSLQEIFQRAEKMTGLSIHVTYVQIYCERIFDLLNPQAEPSALSIRQSDQRGIYIEGATTTKVTSAQDCFNCIEAGNANRAVAATNMNVLSSRSHAIFILDIQRTEVNEATNSTQVKSSQLYMVDLAGSERVEKSLVTGRHFNELTSINLSLSALGNCVAALAMKTRHVPYRDSKLTRLLQSSLGGNAKTSLIVTVAATASDACESLATLRFGQRAMKVQVQAKLNILPDYKALYESVQSHIDKRDDRINELEMQLQKLQDTNGELNEEIADARLKTQQLQAELHSERSKAQTKTFSVSSGEEANQTQASTEELEALEAKFQAEIEKLHQDHLQQLEDARTHYAQQIATYKSASNNASQEWHILQHELQNEQTGHLKTLQDYRETNEKLTQLEIETTQRIADLHEALQTKEKSTTAEAELQQKLTHKEEQYQTLQRELEQDYVSREQIEQMESLYSDAIQRLQKRVDELEISSSNNNTRTPQRSILNKRTQQSKAVPRVGRVEPARSNNNTRFR